MESSCTRFTAAEGGARLAACAGSKNILVTEHTAFISTSVLTEHAYKIRGSLSSGSQRSVYITRLSRIECVSHELTILTDLAVIKAHEFDDIDDWGQELEVKQVIVCTSEVLQRILKEQIIKIPDINVLIIDSCHLIFKDEYLQYIMKLYKQCEGIKPRILALTYPLFTAPKDTNEQTGKNIDNVNVNNRENETCVEKDIQNEISEGNDIKDEIDEGIDVKDSSCDEENDLKDTLGEKKRTKDDNHRVKADLSKNELMKDKISIETRKGIVSEDDNKTIDKKFENQETKNKSYSEKDNDCKEISKDIENLAKIIKIDEKDNKNSESKDNIEKIDERVAVKDNFNIGTNMAIDINDIDENADKDGTVIGNRKIEMDNMDDFNLYEKLEWKIEELEKELCCDMDLAEDIDGGKRLSATLTKPKELIIEFNPKLPAEALPESYTELENYMRCTVNAALDFINEHRYDPTEIYGEDMYEEFANIPDPTLEPKHILKEFLYVLDQLGPYAADKAAFSLLIKLEKLKIKVPYERHFLLLCLCTSVFVKIRCYADVLFSKCASDWEKITTFSTPKVLRLAEILEQFQPPENMKEIEAKNIARNNTDSTINKSTHIAEAVSEIVLTDTNTGDSKNVVDSNKVIDSNDTIKGMKRSKTNELLSTIEKCDFVTLGNKIEDRVNTYEANLKDLDDLESTIVTSTDVKKNEVHSRNEDENKTEGSITNDKETIDTFINCDSEAKDEKNTIDLTNKIDSDNAFNSVIKDTKTFDSVQKDSENKIDNSSNKDIKNSVYTNAAKDIGSVKKDNENNIDSDRNTVDSNKLGVVKRTGHRTRGRGRPQRGNAIKIQQMQQNPDALCGIIFMKEALMAKIMFMMIVDMSRSRPSLSHLCAQYCATEAEGRDCQKEGKKQEEVLKKFRMHECNLLLATSVLEEGIDLPRCNLVVRWDVPPSYRSHGLCRGRARAPRASVALLASSESHSEALLHNLAVYKELDQIITRKCGCGIQFEPPQEEENHADSLALIVKPYTPVIITQNNGPNSLKHDNTRICDKKDENIENIRQNVEKCAIKDHTKEKVRNFKYKDTDIGDTYHPCDSFDEISKDIHEKSNEFSVSGDREAIHSNICSKKTANIIIDKISYRNEDLQTNSSLEGSCNSYSNTKPITIAVSNVLTDSQVLKPTNIPQNENMVANLNSLSKLDEDNEINKKDLTTKEHKSNRNKLSKNDVNNYDTCMDNLNECDEIDNSMRDEKRTNNDEKNVEVLSDKNLDRTEDLTSKENKNLDFREVLDVLDIDKDLNHENLELNDENELISKDINVKFEGIKFEYKVNDSKREESVASVDLNSAIALINRYCGKLPSDTFTRLAPQWWMERVRLPDKQGVLSTAYVCTLRLPLNCPVKYNIVGHPMPTRVLARRMAALQACRILHKSGELDNQLMPIGKENFKAPELENNVACNEPVDTSDCARPGTTKRRQYYFKRTAWAFTDCQAIIDATDSEIEANPTPENPLNEDTAKSRSNILYAIVSRLWCALPERYNTRGRRLHAPQHAPQAIGVLMARREPTQLQIPAFPVYTRSGEVQVSVEPAMQADVRLSPRRARLIRRFMRFVFSDVLRVRRRGMKLQTEGTTHNNYYIVPTVKKTRWDETSWIDVDWPFLELIYNHTEEKKMLDIEKPMLWEQDDKKKDKEKDSKVKNMENPLLKPGEVFTFDAEKYKEAVVTPWYRNQDQPQFFLVAEICWKLSPDSAFPSAQHDSFRSYYKAKYGAELTQSCQPLLDVDHTSARLNLLTPRYVNRKGVALPVSSERTRRAKRDRLDQKQILVPELCQVHPFAAPLWFATVALPCVLYRINALLIADEIRRAVAIDVGLGIPRIDDQTCPGFQWPPLDFGWSLAEVLSADSEKIEKKKDEEESQQEEKDEESNEKEEQEEIDGDKAVEKEKTINDILQEKLDAENGFEIGTWSNDMASSIPEQYDEYMEPLSSNLTFCTSSSGGANWSDPIEKPKGQFKPTRSYYVVADSDGSYTSSDFDTDDSDLTDCSDDDTNTTGFFSIRNSNVTMGVRIEYKTAHEAEAVDLERRQPIAPAPQPDKLDDERDLAEYTRVLKDGTPPKEYVNNFRKSVAKHKKEIKDNGNLISKDKPIVDLLPEPNKDVEKHINASKDKTVNDNKFNDNLSQNILKDKEIDIIISPEDNKTVLQSDKRDNLKSVECDIILSDKLYTDTSKDIKDRFEMRNEYTCDNKATIEYIRSENQDDANVSVENSKTKNDKRILESLKSNDEKIKSTIPFNVNTNELNTEAFKSKRNEELKIIENYRKNYKSQTINNQGYRNSLDNTLENKEGSTKPIQKTKMTDDLKSKIEEMFPYKNGIDLENGEITLESIEKNKRYLLAELKNSLPNEEIKKLNCFSMKDIDIDSPEFVNEKVANIGFDSKEKYQGIVNSWSDANEYKPYYMDSKGQNGKEFDFDYQPDLKGHPGPSPSVILQALTMSNANDGINLERLETIGDSFLKFAITAYLYCAHPAVHEGKLSHMRSKQVSNLNLYRLGRNKRLGARMIASKFEPHDNWLPPCHKPPPTLHPSLAGENKEPAQTPDAPVDSAGCFIPYNLITQHSIPDKSIADCVEALIGAYLLECGPRGALLFMSWLGIRVLPSHTLPLPDNHPYVTRAQAERVESRTVQKPTTSKPVEPISSDSCCSDDEETDPELSAPEPDWGWPGRPVGALRPYRDKDGRWMQPIFGELKAPPSPLLRYIEDPEGELEQMLSGYDALERTLQYRFRDRSLLLQALTHASHQKNRLTDCYQRLEFLGDAILDYLITRHLYEDPRRHSPGALTDLRSALVNNTIFATLAARHGFHKYFRHMSPGLNEVLTKYVKIQEENGHSISEEHYLIQEDEMEQAEDVEVPKALGDLFESVAGAIFLDSGMSLGAVWRSVGGLLGAELDAFSAAAPKSPVRELLEAEPDTAKFGKPERLADGRRVRVCVEVFGRGAFKGIGRNYRIAKGTAARCALRHLRTHKPR